MQTTVPHNYTRYIDTHTNTDELYATIFNMGGFMQSWGYEYMQLHMPRFCRSYGTHDGVLYYIEEGVDGNTFNLYHFRIVFGET
mmetsp:Transcript_23225/g.29300  ORF Transcript_23225/g.29300 Transcript_23225/m.29300 type:complete len:84 (+) Transcript_23225:70-321(+)